MTKKNKALIKFLEGRFQEKIKQNKKSWNYFFERLSYKDAFRLLWWQIINHWRFIAFTECVSGGMSFNSAWYYAAGDPTVPFDRLESYGFEIKRKLA